MTKDVKHCFKCLLEICIFPFENCLFSHEPIYWLDDIGFVLTFSFCSSYISKEFIYVWCVVGKYSSHIPQAVSSLVTELSDFM